MKLCKNGHDLDVVGYYESLQADRTNIKRECKRCKIDRVLARKRNKARRKKQQPQPRPRQRNLKEHEIERVMDLRDRAQWITTHWERDKLLAEADAICEGKHV